MEKISIFNYEAYYLDFLEGNLSEEDTALLLAFLEKHPELKLEDDFLPEFNQETATLDPSFKAGLKQIELTDDAISVDNAEQFIIAETEGLLNASQKMELDAVIAQDGSLQKMRTQYEATRLKPDLRITFPDKDKLKKGRTIVLWPYISLAAAASVAAFFFLFNTPNEGAINGNNGSVVAQGDTLKPKADKTEDDEKNSVGPGQELAFDPDQTTKNNGPADRPVNGSIRPAATPNTRDNRELNVDRLQTQQVSATELAFADQEIIERNFVINKPTPSVPAQDQATLGFDDMKNPIKPVTNRLGDLINKEVDFRTAKADAKKPGGFLFRIGNFEISHKGH